MEYKKKTLEENNKRYDMENKIYEAIRSKYGYGDEGDAIVNWLMNNLK